MLNENWLEMVDSYNYTPFPKLRRQEALEKAASWFRMLGWKKSNGTMKLFIDDDDINFAKLVLSYILDNGNAKPFLDVVISTKDIVNCIDVANQAMSLSDSTLCLVISNKIELICKSDTQSEPIFAGSIHFEPNDLNGSKLSSLLNYDEFNFESLTAFFNELINLNNRLLQLKNDIFSIHLDQDLFRSFLKDALLQMGYNESDIDSELTKVKFQLISVDEQKQTTLTHHDVETFVTKSSHDNTKFSFDGINFYNKRTFVLKLIQRYVKDHPMVTLDELENQFPSNIISKKRGVVRSKSIVMKWIEENPDLMKRYCMKDDEIITLHDGEQIVVYNQWGTRFPFFLNIAKKLYPITSDKPYSIDCKEYDYVDSSIDDNTVSDSGITISESSLKTFIDNR